MTDYRAYKLDKNGKTVEVPPEELAKFLGVSEYDANLILKGMNIGKSICVIAGQLENPPLVWNKNMPKRFVEFVANLVASQLKNNPAWSIRDFDWNLIYDKDDNLKY